MTKFRFLIFLIIANLSLNSFGQKIKNVRISQDEKSVVVLYDLIGKKKLYNVNFYYILDNEKTCNGPLKDVIGDVANQMPGKGKKAIWNPLKSESQIEGNIQFLVIPEPNLIESDAGNTYNTKANRSPDFYKYKKSKNIWLGSSLVSGAVGAYSFIQAEKYYDEYQTVSATADAADLHQKVKLFDQLKYISLGVAGLSTIVFVIQAENQHNAKKTSVSFYPQPLKNGLGFGLVCKF